MNRFIAAADADDAREDVSSDPHTLVAVEENKVGDIDEAEKSGDLDDDPPCGSCELSTEFGPFPGLSGGGIVVVGFGGRGVLIVKPSVTWRNEIGERGQEGGMVRLPAKGFPQIYLSH